MSKLSREERDAKRKMKEMEDAARAEAMASAPVTVIQPEGEDQSLLSFDQWWMIAQARKPLRPHMKEIIWADMRARGLSKRETQDKYDKALRLFGYSW